MLICKRINYAQQQNCFLLKASNGFRALFCLSFILSCISKSKRYMVGRNQTMNEPAIRVSNDNNTVSAGQ